MHCRDSKSHNDAQAHMHSHNFEDLVKSFDDPARDAWQKPTATLDFVNSQMSPAKKMHPESVTFADLGAGSGYFTFRLVDKGVKVIALDLDDRFISLLKTRAEAHPKRANLQIRKATSTNSGLNAAEADVIISVDVYHHIDDRVMYFTNLRNALKPGGFICIIDFKEGDLPVGPPAKMKISENTIMNELSKAGYAVQVNSVLLQNQNIFIARPARE